MLLCLVRMARQRRTPGEIPQVLDKLFMPVVVSGADVQTAQNTRGDSTGAVLGQIVHAPLLCLVPMARQRRTPVEIPKVPFLDKLFMPVVVSGADVQTALNTRGDSTGAVLGQVVDMPGVVSGADVQTALNIRGDSTGAVLGQVVHARCCVWVPMARQRRTPVEIPKALDKLFMPVVVSGADVQTALNTRGDSTGAAVLGQVVHARCCVWCRCPDSAEHPWRFHRCRRSWTNCSCSLLCLVPMSRQR